MQRQFANRCKNEGSKRGTSIANKNAANNRFNTRDKQSFALNEQGNPQPCLSMTNEKYERKISAKVAARIADLAERLFDFIPNTCWMTEAHLANALNVSMRQIKNAKAYLVSIGKIQIELRQNGKRANPIHTLVKPFPINQNSIDETSDENESRINWSLFDNLSARDFNDLSLEEKLEFYEEMRLPFIPLHFPKFDNRGKAFCSCRFGRYCNSIGKHPATAYKSLDFSSQQTFKAMKAYWQRDARYNVGFVVDGFTVIDVDFRKGGAYSLGLLQEIYDELPQNLTVKTGNGLHIYARGNNSIKNGVDVLGFRGIDVRANGSFIVAPFSDHFSGNQYKWLSVSSPESLPQDLIDALLESESQPMNLPLGTKRIDSTSPLPSRDDSDFTIQDGARNDTLFRLASRERGKGAEYAEILNYLQKVNAKNCTKPLDERELLNIAKSVMRFPSNSQKYRFSRQHTANI